MANENEYSHVISIYMRQHAHLDYCNVKQSFSLAPLLTAVMLALLFTIIAPLFQPLHINVLEAILFVAMCEIRLQRLQFMQQKAAYI